MFLGKQDDSHVRSALDFCTNNFDDVQFFSGQWGGALPEQAKQWEGDYIISYLSRWIVPESLLQKAKLASINFHPASPDYPGFGCVNFALYEESKDYGSTCHHMKTKVDTGNIIAVKRFPVFPTDNVETVLARTYAHQLCLFYEVIGYIIEGKELPESSERWSRKPFTRKDFNQLDQITPDMTKEEVAKRIRATSFGKWKPTLKLHDFIFEPK